MYLIIKKSDFFSYTLDLVISTSLTSNNRLSRSENPVPVKHKILTSTKILWKSQRYTENIVEYIPDFRSQITYPIYEM